MALLDFETTGPHSPIHANVQTWAEGDVIHRMSYINKLASKSFDYFTKVFKTPHPLRKLDILILPDVEFEVEETFGIIFMRYVCTIQVTKNYFKAYEKLCLI